MIVTEIISVSHYFYGRASYKLKKCIMMIIIETDWFTFSEPITLVSSDEKINSLTKSVIFDRKRKGN